ncbi:MAG: type I restriction endonuclease [Oscillospiraceae bacterium]
MAIDIREKVFETEIEYCLTTFGGYEKGNSSDFDALLGMDAKTVVRFICDTQPKSWESLCKRHGDRVQQDFIKRLSDEIKSRGTLDVLRHGIKDLGVEISLCYFKPANKMNKTTVERYEANILSVMRQVHHSVSKPKDSVDTVLLLNGLPIITMELKNPLTGQTYDNAIKQYEDDRSNKDTLFAFKRGALVHFAVDTEEVYMTTKLAGKSTVFLPFNKGNNNGAGNPVNPDGFRTSYLWEEVLVRDSIVDIIERYLHLSKQEDKKTGKEKESLIFPRYHQLDVVRKLLADAKETGSGKNYLIQHSAGSGKSNSIAWLAHHLSTLHDDTNQVVFNSIVVITDRRVLDRQLQDTIYQFEHVDGVVTKIDEKSSISKSKQLIEALNNNAKIIITTLQTFPFILERVGHSSQKRFAVIVDEAHSSQTGTASEKLKEALAEIEAKGNDEIEEKLHQFAEAEAKVENQLGDSEDEIAREMASHGLQKNLSFFAFTATPKPKTLEIFGVKGSDGLPHAFHVYSMRQAIEEKFILDVLENYTTYRTYFQVGKKISDDPVYGKNKANKALGKFLSLHPHNLAQKTEIIIEHFRSVTRHEIGGKAKAMLVTGSRLHAVRYYFEFLKYIKKMKYTDLGVLVAFSGNVRDNGKDFTEAGLNKFSEGELPERFDSEEYQILLVAEKYQTGFDQPLLHTMYVDKKLSGVKAVQTLSRLNRMCYGKNDTFVLDFANDKEDIFEAFQPYYERTDVDDITDPNLIYDLKNTLDGYRIYAESEVKAFSKVFFKESAKQTALDFGKLSPYLDPAVDRYKALENNEEKKEFKIALRKFTRLYSFICHIIKLGDGALHEFSAYAKCLLRKLPADEQEKTPNLDNDVTLQYYRLQKIFDGKIQLEQEVGVLPGGRHGAGLPIEEEKATLSEVIAKLNERLGTNFTEIDKVIEQFVEDMAKNPEMQLRAKNPMDMFQVAYENNIMDVVIARLQQNQDFCTKYIEDTDFRGEIDKIILPLVHERLASVSLQ